VARVASLALVAIGAFLLKMCVFDVLAAARRGETVHLSMRGTIIAPGAILLGIVLTYVSFTRANPREWGRQLTNPETKRLSPRGWVIVIVMLGAGLGLYLWTKSQLVALGYEF
jgi:hypothetical protein